MKILISYRREDTQAVANRMYGELKRHFGVGNVYLDVVGNKAGVDFRTSLEAALEACNVVVAVVGRSWLGVKENRFRSSEDYVRQEMEAALRNNVRIIPVLVDGAQMPPPEALPASVRDFVYRQGVDLNSGRRFETDMLTVLQLLDLADTEMFPSIWRRLRRLMRRRRFVAWTAILGPTVVAASVAALTFNWIPVHLAGPNANGSDLAIRPNEQSSPGSATVRTELDPVRPGQLNSQGTPSTSAGTKLPRPRPSAGTSAPSAEAPSRWAYYEVNRSFSTPPNEGSVIVLASPRLPFSQIRSGAFLRADTDVNLYGQPPATDETSLKSSAIREILPKGACLKVLEDASSDYDKTQHAWAVSGIESAGFLKVRKSTCP